MKNKFLSFGLLMLPAFITGACVDQTVDKNNLMTTVIKDGYAKFEDVSANVPTEASEAIICYTKKTESKASFDFLRRFGFFLFAEKSVKITFI